MSVLRPLLFPSLVATSLVLGGAALASDSFGEGSFGDDSGAVTPAVTPEKPATGPKPATQSGGVSDVVGGSFDETKPKPEPETKPTQTTSQGDGFDDGSFQDGGGPTPIVKVKPKPPTPKDPILAFEMRDFGVRPTGKLRRQQMHAPTPIAIPSGKLISTAQVFEAIKSGQQIIMIDVLGGQYTLPNSYVEPRVAYGGTFRDRIQQQTAAWLTQLSRGNRATPIVMYCSDPMCWMSYNASLRAINAGFTNVFWYRGGKKAWRMAGHQTVPTGF